MSTETTSQEEQGKEAKKVLVGFEQTIKKLTAIVQGEGNLKPQRKVAKDTTKQLVEELFKEESEATANEVKEGLKALLKGYVTLNNTLSAERKKLDNLEVSKKKEFNVEANKLFSKIECIDSILTDYYGAMQAAQDSVTQE
jgi:hypothetical protein